MFIVLSLRTLPRSKSAELSRIFDDKGIETTTNNTLVSIISDKVNKTNISVVHFNNITDPLACVQQWQENNMSLENAVLCIDKYVRSQNKT